MGNHHWSVVGWGRWVLLLPLLWLAGCTTVPDQPSVPDAGYEAALLTAFHADQAHRRQLLHWTTMGVFDLESPDDSRRHRVKFSGFRSDRARMQVFGPFRQVVMDLRLLPDKILLIDPSSRRILSTPPDAHHMGQMLKLQLEPQRLVDLVLGMCGSISSAASANSAEKGVLTTDGERIVLQAPSGLPLERIGTTDNGRGYRVVYTWPEEPTKGMPVTLPATVTVSLDDETRILLTFKRWRDKEDRTLTGMRLPKGFELMEAGP